MAQEFLCGRDFAASAVPVAAPKPGSVCAADVGAASNDAVKAIAAETETMTNDSRRMRHMISYRAAVTTGNLGRAAVC